MADRELRETRTSSSWRAHAGRLAVELVVVFIGLYAAFAVSEYQADREAEERREQLRLALVREIAEITANVKNGAAGMAETLVFYDAQLENAGTPALHPLIEAIDVRTHMWEATLASGGIDLFDVATVHDLSAFYNELNAGFAQIGQLRALSESILIPNLDRGTDEFYSAPGQLRAKYAWYLSGLRNLHRLAVRIAAMGDSLVGELGPEPAVMPD
jgi:hypothetical protein